MIHSNLYKTNSNNVVINAMETIKKDGERKIFMKYTRYTPRIVYIPKS